MVDNSRLRFSVAERGDGFFQHVWLDEDGNGQFWPEEMIVNSAQGGHLFLEVIRTRGSGHSPGHRSGVQGTVACYGARAHSVDVRKRKGREAVVVRGAYEDPAASPYTLELEAVPDESAIRVRHRLDFQGRPGRDLVKAWGLRVPFRYRMGRDFKKRLVSYGCEAGAEEVLVEQTSWSEFGNQFNERIHAHALEAAARPAERSQGWAFALPCLPEDQIPWPYWTVSALVQERPALYRVWKATGRGVSSLPVRQGRRCGGWVDLSDERWGMAVGIAEMARRAPKALEVDAALDATRGEVTVYLHPRHVAPLDLRPTFQGQPAESRQKALGLSQTQTVVFYFHAGSARDAGVDAVVARLLAEGR